MPVTARLSRRFYEKLGEDVANELVDWLNAVDATYRADLRELNELNFSRFDARLEQRLAQLDAKWEQRFAQLDAKWEQRLVQLDAAWERRFVRLDGDLRRALAETRAELLRWAFLFWATTLGALYAFTRAG